MTPEEFIETVREENRTALSRLGSSKALYADTGGEMETETVLAAAAAAERAAAETFEEWAADEADDAARQAFEAAAETARDHHRTIADEFDGHGPGEAPAVYEHLRGLSDTVERAGGFVGRVLAHEKKNDQLTGFFVGQADPRTAQAFREMGDDLDAQLAGGRELLDELCDGDDDWDRALAAASGAIQAAYDEYTGTLEAMGVNPKPVC